MPFRKGQRKSGEVLSPLTHSWGRRHHEKLTTPAIGTFNLCFTSTNGGTRSSLLQDIAVVIVIRTGVQEWNSCLGASPPLPLEFQCPDAPA